MNTLRPFLVSGLVLWASAACAQYKIVGPDGTVTYTDRPPDASARAVPISGGRGEALTLPLALRPVVGRYPVTLYASPNCTPCDLGRSLLTQRGIPFAEKRIETDADATALTKLTGENQLPVLTIGTQQLKGYQPRDWHSYLDAAAYPSTSVLPASYRPPAPTPLAPPSPTPPELRKPEPTAPKPPPADPNAPTIRF